MTQQEWVNALAPLQDGNLALDKAQSLLRSITQLESNLQKAKDNAPQEVAAAQADIDQAAQYLHQYDEDMRKSLESDLRTAAGVLADAKAELEQSLPDYLRVVELATKANQAADGILREATSEHEAAERLRRQAKSVLGQAQAAVSQADEYHDDHSSDVESSAENSLSSAKRALQQATSSRSSQDRLAYATTALEHANQAYSQAKSDVDDAEERRRPHYSSGGFGSSYGGSSSWGSSSFGSDGGGSSSSWGGSSGDGGGSSTSW